MRKVGKIILFGVCLGVMIFFSGCGIYNKIDLKKAKKDITALTTTKMDFQYIKNILDKQTVYFNILEDIESLEKAGISLEYVAKEKDYIYAFREEKTTEQDQIATTSYIIVKPAEDKKELLEEQIDQYYEKKQKEYENSETATIEGKERLNNIMKKEYDGYLIYIVSKDNEAVWKLIEKNAHPLLFEQPKELSLDNISETFSIFPKDIIDYQVLFPTNANTASLYIIIQPKKNKVDDVQHKLNEYMQELERKWEIKSPTEYQLVKNRMTTEVGGYLIYIVSKDNEAVLQTIKNAAKKKD